MKPKHKEPAMGIMESVKNWIQPQRDPHTLYISIDEIS